MKKINKTTMMLFALVLTLSVTVGATFAYFSDYEQASGGATLYLGGKTELTEGNDKDQKDIVIENTGKTNMIVRVGIYGPGEMADPVMKGKWMKSEKDGMYYYGEVLRPGKDGQPGDNTGAGNLVAKMSFNWQGDAPDYYFEVTVVHEGSQVLYDNDGELVCPDGWDAAMVAQIQPPASE